MSEDKLDVHQGRFEAWKKSYYGKRWAAGDYGQPPIIVVPRVKMDEDYERYEW